MVPLSESSHAKPSVSGRIEQGQCQLGRDISTGTKRILDSSVTHDDGRHWYQKLISRSIAAESEEKMNITALVGFIASMLGLQVSSKGVKYLKFDLAVKNSAANNSTTFVKCVAFGKTAEFIAAFFKVGSPIGVIAEVCNNNYIDANNVKHYSYEFHVWKANFVGRKTDNPAAVVAGTVVQPFAQPVQTVSVAGGQSFQPVSGSAQASTPAFGTSQVVAGGGAQPYAQPVQTASVTGRSSFPPAPGSTQAPTPISGATQVAAGGCAQFPAGSATPNTPEQGIKLRKLNDIYTQDEMKIVDSDEFADE